MHRDIVFFIIPPPWTVNHRGIIVIGSETQSLINHVLENPVFPRREVEIADEIFMRASNSWFCAI